MAALVNLNVATAKFAFVNINREVNIKDLKPIIKKDGHIFNPIMVVSANDIDLSTYSLIDPRSKKQIDSPTADTMVVLDGQHRLSCALELLNDYALEKERYETQYEIWAKDGKNRPEPNVPEDYTIKEIEAIVKCKDEVEDVNTFIIRLNSTSRNWNNKDYVHDLAIANKDEVSQTIEAFTNLGFSISSVSRYMTFNRECISNKTVALQLEEGTPFKHVNHKRAIKIYLTLRKLGFQNKFLKSRYVIDYIINSVHDRDLEPTMTMISSLKLTSIQKACGFTGEEFETRLEKEIKQDHKEAVKDNAVRNIYDTITDAMVEEFINGGYKDYIDIKPTKKVLTKQSTQSQPLNGVEDKEEDAKLMKKVESLPQRDNTTDIDLTEVNKIAASMPLRQTPVEIISA